MGAQGAEQPNTAVSGPGRGEAVPVRVVFGRVRRSKDIVGRHDLVDAGLLDVVKLMGAPPPVPRPAADIEAAGPRIRPPAVAPEHFHLRAPFSLGSRELQGELQGGRHGGGVAPTDGAESLASSSC